MLWTLFVIMLVLWVLGMIGGVTFGGFLHVLLLLAVVVLVVRLMEGRHPVA